MILDVYAARETDDLGIASADLVQRLPAGTSTARDPADAARLLAAVVAPGDVVLTLGAGSITDTGPLLLDLLQVLGETAPPLRPSVQGAPASSGSRADAEAMTIPGSPRLKVLRDAPMRLHTTWRIGGPADFLVRAATPDDLVAAVTWGRRKRVCR